jgi:hypothetical protein
MRGRNVNSLVGVVLIIATSVIFGFILLRGTDSLSDEIEYGVDTLQILRELNEQLRQDK